MDPAGMAPGMDPGMGAAPDFRSGAGAVAVAVADCDGTPGEKPLWPAACDA
jgi:hypothetical protein